VFEAVTIRRQGYPARMLHAAFYKRFRSLASLSPDASELGALPMASGGVPSDPRRACEVLIRVLAQQPPLARMAVECQIGKTMLLWRTEVNKAITLVRADVERKVRTFVFDDTLHARTHALTHAHTNLDRRIIDG
jgi:myosin heavy subunit